MLENQISILAIEDDADVRQSIAAFYKDYGYEVFEAENGAKGVEMFHALKPDLVFTDLRMPGMDGLEVVSTVCQASPDTPVIVISGTGQVRDSVEALRRGAWDYIAKPVIDFGELELAIRRAFERVELNRSVRRQHDAMIKTIAEQNTMLQAMGECDQLTDLPNRQRLRQIFFEAVSAEEMQADIAVFLLGLDNFGLINEAIGHDSGDRLLKMVAERLRSVVGSADTLVRLGGDQFVIMMTNTFAISEFILSLMEQFNSPFEISGHELFLTASTGIAMFPQDGESIERLIQNADVAMAKAKKMGKNRFLYYTRELSAKAQARLMMESHLHHALARNEYVLHFQPQYDAISRRISGMEALLRWKPANEERLVSPEVFIPVLEETALIVDVGGWVLHSACRQYVYWRAEGMPALRLSVNISACQFHAGNLVETVRAALESSGMEASCLCLEITESVVMKDIESTVRVLGELSEMGVELSLDDFGTGFSSLCYLNRMPLDELKIDKTFVSHLPHEQNAVSIVESVLELARGLDLKVVAEGVETAAQADFLQEHGCQCLQGYLLSRPLTAENLGRLFKRGCAASIPPGAVTDRSVFSGTADRIC